MKTRAIILSAIVTLPLVAVASVSIAQGYPPGNLEDKRLFMGRESEAIAQPFIGVRTSDGLREGLFPLRSTGASTVPVRLAAEQFLATLTPVQTMRTQFPYDDIEWRRWFNVDNGIYSRQGTSLREMSPEQKEAARALMRQSLSARGYSLSQAIMLTDQALREINDDSFNFDPELYYFTIMGTPSATEPWGWQIDGHHLVINFFVLGDQVVMTPTFWGGEPAHSTQGSTAGNVVLQAEQDMGLALMQSLSSAQRAVATIEARKTGANLVAAATQDNLVLDYAGIRADALTAAQRADLMQLIGQYVGNLRQPHAAVQMTEIEAHLNETYFAWVGATGDDAIFYYRIHSPVILVEFDHQGRVGTRILQPGEEGPVRDHIRTMVRTPNGNDYGRDLLGQHLARSHAH